MKTKAQPKMPDPDAFLSGLGLKIKLRRLGCRRELPNGVVTGPLFLVRVIRGQGFKRRTLTFTLHGSMFGPMHPINFLLCGASSAEWPETFRDYCCDWGFDPNTRSNYRRWKSGLRLAGKVKVFFSQQELVALAGLVGPFNPFQVGGKYGAQ